LLPLAGSAAEAMGQASSDHLPVVKATGLSKQYGNVQALIDVDLEIYPREIVALAGDKRSRQIHPNSV
jgi:ABC-type phosphonate transport system ATPase subunit